MSGAERFVRQHILEMPPYEPILPFEVLSEELGIPVEALVKLDANENPYGPLPSVREALGAVKGLHIYPDPESRSIRRRLAAQHGVSEGSIVMGAGADELIDLIIRIVLEPGEALLNCPPTFGMYSFDGVLNQAKVISVPRRADFSLDMDAIRQVVEKDKPRLLFLANPNNPDGGMIPEEVFQQLAALPLLLVMDEAYIQFRATGRSVLDEVARRENLIVLRTFSKWAGLAGLRLGYGVFPETFVPMLMKAKQPYNVSVAAEQAALATMDNLEIAEARINNIVKERQQLYQILAQFPWLETYPSEANFILCKVSGIPAITVKQQLRQQGILIRHFDKPGLSDHIRISVGTPAQIKVLTDGLKRIEVNDENRNN